MGLIERSQARLRSLVSRRANQEEPAPFIVGVPRSGTTLLRLMLDAHPELAIPPETFFVPRLIRLCKELEAADAPEALRRSRALELITSHPRWNDLGLEAEALERELGARPFGTADAVRAVYRVYCEREGKARWGDKTPGYLARMTRIQLAVPEARFIHLIRDGRDVALSLSEVSWGIHDLEEAALRWVSQIRKARRRARALARGTYLEIRYEDLVSDPERSARGVCELIELDWDPAVLAYHRQADERLQELVRDFRSRTGDFVTAEERARQHALVTEPPRTDRVGRWRQEMPRAERERFEAIAGPLLERLSYPVGAEADAEAAASRAG
jgi:hypothetical protein